MGHASLGPAGPYIRPLIDLAHLAFDYACGPLSRRRRVKDVGLDASEEPVRAEIGRRSTSAGRPNSRRMTDTIHALASGLNDHVSV